MMPRSHCKISLIFFACAAMVGAGAAGAQSLIHAQASPIHPAILAASDSAPQPIVARLKNGVSVELLGIAKPGEATGQPVEWWSADGALLDFGPFARTAAPLLAPNFRRGYITREFAVRINRKIDGSSEPGAVTWSIVGSQSSLSSTAQDNRGRTIPDLEVQLMPVPDNRADAMLRADIASGPWITRMSTDLNGDTSMAMGSSALLFSRGFETDGHTYVIFSHTGSNRNERFIAVTKTGKTIPASTNGGGGANGVTMEEIEIPAPLKSIKKLEYQTRPWNQWIEIRNIALYVDQGTTPRVVTSDQPDKK